MYFIVTDLDWELFEQQFNIPRTDVIEVNNIYRHVCKLFILKKTDLQLWKDKNNVTVYELVDGNKWIKNTIKH
jgi:hypothetical protein